MFWETKTVLCPLMPGCISFNLSQKVRKWCALGAGVWGNQAMQADKEAPPAGWAVIVLKPGFLEFQSVLRHGACG